MKSNAPFNPWRRLVSAAREVSADRAESAPYGFSTRVAAMAFAAGRGRSLLDRFAFRAVGVACLLALASAVINYSFTSVQKTPTVQVQTEEQANADDPMAVLLDA